jgi:hypothetical protein
MIEWISVEDRMPEEGVHNWVLGYTPYAFYVCAYVKIKGSWHDREFQLINITHWMPLPEPPEKEEAK